MMTERIGVVIVNWNETELTLECIGSIVAVAPNETAIVLVDNGSPDDPTPRVVAAFPTVHVVRLFDNRGYAAGCNVGAASAIALGATHLLFINNDATMDAAALPALLAASRARPKAILGPKIVYADRPDRVWSAGGSLRLPWMQNDHLDRGAPSVSVTGTRRVDWTTGCALFVTTAIYCQLGPLDEGYFLYLEDIDWCLRGRAMGLETWCVPDAVVLHRVSRSTSRLPSAEVFYYGCRNTYRLAFTHSSPWRAAIMWPAVLFAALKVVGRNLVSASHRRDPLYQARTRAIFDFLRGRDGPLRGVVRAVRQGPAAITG